MHDTTNLFARLPEALVPWYRANARDLPWRRSKDPYRVWVSEIMLQQTRVEAVMGYYARFLQAFPTVEALADAPEEQLLKLWEGLGYYSRARNLQKAAKVIVQQHGGRFPATYDAIRALPGVGPYTAGAVASICFEQPVAAVDGNVLRVAARLTQLQESVDDQKVKKDIGEALSAVYPAGACGDFTQALMELGATVCTPRSPKCETCPLKEMCRAAQSGTQADYPRRSPKREKRQEARTVLLLHTPDGRVAILKRGGEGLLANLWQLPNTAGTLSEEEALSFAKGLGAQPLQLESSILRSHVFTHIVWNMTCYRILCTAAEGGAVWVPLDEVRERYALPTAFRMFLEDMK